MQRSLRKEDRETRQATRADADEELARRLDAKPVERSDGQSHETEDQVRRNQHVARLSPLLLEAQWAGTTSVGSG